ncbi:Glycine oxidase [Candidatus Sulfotelmatobacter sp. SbA7]|nr:Glycine oxidase [Candidatus Sulfotelmatobacter sp. SbA7]
MKSWDAIIVGAGIVGVSLAIELNQQGQRVLVVEKGEPGREASWAAGGMLADFPAETPPRLRELATASARMYPEFVRELEDGSGLKIDLRSVGTLVLFPVETGQSPVTTQAYALPGPLAELEPALRISARTELSLTPLFVKERCVDPRHLTTAAIAAARHRGVDFSSGDQVLAVEVANGRASGVRTSKTQFAAGMVVNCAGAWAGQISPHHFPTRPVKGQMLCVAMPEKELVRHVVRTVGWTPDVYLIPRSDGRMVIGATAEEAGFDKQTVPETIQKLRQAALDLVPKLAEARILEAWAGLRPGTPDGLPILGATPTPGYFVATGHFRDGILLAPVTAKLMAQMILGQKPEFGLEAFGAERFES